MVYAKSLIAAFAAVASVSAQSSSSCGSQTVQNQGDATKVGACPKVSGDITINAQAGTTLDFGTKLTEITGKVSMSNDNQIQTLSFNALSKLDSLVLNNLTVLSTLNLGNLTAIGDLDLRNLGTLNSFNFGSGLASASNVRIENVQITDLSGIASAKTISSIVLANNQFLSNIMFNLTQVGIVDIGANNKAQGQNVNFPSLVTATSLTIRNSTTVQTPLLRNVSETLSLIGNTFTSYTVPNLTWVGALVLNSNPKITNFSFPQLQQVNSSDNATLEIQNNTQLSNVAAFPKLTKVEGAVNLFGNIKNISFPVLNDVSGAMKIDTSAAFDCGLTQPFADNQTVKGAYSCKANNANPEGSSGSSTSSGGSSTSSGAAVPLTLPTFLTTGAFAAVLAFLA